MIDNQPIEVHAFIRCILISLSVDEMLFPRYVNFQLILGVCDLEWRWLLFVSH